MIDNVMLKEVNRELPIGYRLVKTGEDVVISLYKEDIQALAAGTDTPCLRRIARVLDEHDIELRINPDYLPY